MSTGIGAINDRVKEMSGFVPALKSEMAKVIVGQQYLVDRMIVGLLANGHLLLEGVPGLAKTLAVKSLSQAISTTFSRIQFTPDLLPADKPRYLMGVGKPIDLVEAVARGVDMFDCVLPTRSGRHGQAWTWDGAINIKNAKYAEDDTPLDPTSDCPASRDYSKAYLHHLVKADEILGQVLLSWQNIAFFQALMAGMRDAIAEGRFEAFRRDFRARQPSAD